MGSSLTAVFSKPRALLWKYSLPGVFHGLFCTSKGFHCLKEDAVEVKLGLMTTSVGTGVAASSTKQTLRIPTKSEVRETTCTKDTRKQLFYNLNLFVST